MPLVLEASMDVSGADENLQLTVSILFACRLNVMRMCLWCHKGGQMGGSNRGQSYKASTYAGTTARSKNGHTASSRTCPGSFLPRNWER